MNNIKRIIATASILLTLLGLCSCGKTEEEQVAEALTALATDMTQTEQTLQNPNTLYEELKELNAEQQAEQAEQAKPSGAKYESDLLTPLKGSVRHKEQFSQVLTPNGSILQTADGKAYWVDSGESCFTDEEDVAQLVLFNKKNLGYYDSKGYFHINIRGKEYLGSDIKGTILGGFDGMLGGCFILSVDEQGYLYANELTVDGTKGDYVNEPLWLYDYTDKTFHGQVTDIDLFYADSGNFQIYATTADRSFYTYVSGIDHFQDKTQFFISSIEGLGRVWDYGYNKSFTSPIYSKNDADTALYYKNSDNEFAVNLPAGYTVQDIEQVLFGATTVVRMKDHTVYATELTHTVLSPTLEKLDALSNGNVVNLYHNRSANELRVLMDDQVLYTYALSHEAAV